MSKKIKIQCLVEIEIEKNEMPSGPNMTKKEIVEYFASCIIGNELGNVDVIYPVTAKLRKDSERY